MFLTADHLADKPGLNLGPMRREFGYVAKAYKDKIAKGEVEAPGKLFFADAEFKESQEVKLSNCKAATTSSNLHLCSALH